MPKKQNLSRSIRQYSSLYWLEKNYLGLISSLYGRSVPLTNQRFRSQKTHVRLRLGAASFKIWSTNRPVARSVHRLVRIVSRPLRFLRHADRCRLHQRFAGIERFNLREKSLVSIDQISPTNERLRLCHLMIEGMAAQHLWRWTRRVAQTASSTSVAKAAAIRAFTLSSPDRSFDATRCAGHPYGGWKLSWLGGGVLGPDTYLDYLRPQSTVRTPKVVRDFGS